MSFVDEVEVEIIAGKGGDGMVAWRKEKYINRGGPAGGDGGKGGDVIIVATTGQNTLAEYRHRRFLKAKHGRPGGPKDMTGAGGDDLVIEVPLGTLVYDSETDELLADLTSEGDRIVAARGGDGGMGNTRFKTSTNRAPKKATPGYPGEERAIRLELKLIADVALVGYPSVGKSTLISVLSNARPKIADYPFTTLVPNLGVVQWKDYREYVIADVPGLIEGAHEGHGLGIRFLKHIERTNLICHVIEVTQQLEGYEDNRDPFDDYHRIRNELESYAEELVDRPEIVVLNKVDLPWVAERRDEIEAYFVERDIPFLAVSAASRDGLDELRNRLGSAVVEGAFEAEKEDWEV